MIKSQLLFYVLIISVAIAWALSGCAQSDIKSCKSACRGNVLKYSSEEVECSCLDGNRK